MRMLMLALVAVVIIVGTVGTPKAVLAQDCDLCKFENEQHQFEGTPELCTEENRGENPNCRDCSTTPEGHIGCHAAWQGGGCSTHGGFSCGLIVNEEEQEQQDELMALISGAPSMAPHDLAALIFRRPEVTLNVERRAIQATGCSGGVHLQISLGEAETRAVLEAMSKPGRLRFPVG